MKRAAVAIIAGASLLGMGACASPGLPPGGPERHTPPMITRINPDTNSVNVRGRAFVIHFDEVISERPAGVPSLADLVLVSPRDGQPNVEWHRDALTVEPRRSWRKNVAYTVTLLPGIADLRGNVRNSATEVTFSTGPTIPPTVLRGVVFDAISGAPIRNALVEARPATDTTLVYVASADSIGRFHIRGLGPAQYRVRGYDDTNRNRGIDPGESLDSTTITVTDSVTVELLAFVHDTAGPRLTAVSLDDSVTLRATFGTPLSPATPLDTAHFVVTGADSTRVAVLSVRAGRLDTATTPEPQPERPVVPPTAVPIPSAEPAPAVTVVIPKPTRPLLFRDVLITLRTRLRAGAVYNLRAIDALGATGVRLSSDRAFNAPEAPPPTDTARTRSDSAGHAATLRKATLQKATPRKATPRTAAPATSSRVPRSR